ncbi:RNA polymerase sigma factor [Paludicola sp. MB14-C6]|uniref:RNA polymerase sigma factor n=1 Tax=Paludihabitans sp. MB14-C6 TaxID=3070656 RepID=UPI0027DB6CF0|nr:RNA polymerase sigma factor [Paludicola sp. MB14-C6]WMJ23787.1 RNA polymerase sigma factor [Paludicola sp. MB14-C6]
MLPIEELYVRNKQDVYYYLMSLTHNPTLSEDLLSETFLNAIKSLPNFKGDSTIKTWLFSIARNLWLQNLRKQKPTLEYDDLLELYVTDSFEERYIAKQAITRLQELLLTKDGNMQKVFQMRVDGYSYHEIATKLHISESSARVIDFRIKKWLKATLQEEELI